MTPDEKKVLYRIWGRSRATREMIALNLSQDNLLALQAQYREHRLIGPCWSRSRRTWDVWGIRNTGPGQANAMYHYANLETFLDVPTVVAAFHTRWIEQGVSPIP